MAKNKRGDFARLHETREKDGYVATCGTRRVRLLPPFFERHILFERAQLAVACLGPRPSPINPSVASPATYLLLGLDALRVGTRTAHIVTADTTVARWRGRVGGIRGRRVTRIDAQRGHNVDGGRCVRWCLRYVSAGAPQAARRVTSLGACIIVYNRVDGVQRLALAPALSGLGMFRRHWPPVHSHNDVRSQIKPIRTLYADANML